MKLAAFGVSRLFISLLPWLFYFLFFFNKVTPAMERRTFTGGISTLVEISSRYTALKTRAHLNLGIYTT